MIVSWNWLSNYLRLDMPVEALTERLALAGLNHESTGEVGGDLAIDLEVTSNRPDCLSHIGVAREVSVLFATPLRLPEPRPAPPRAGGARGGHPAGVPAPRRRGQARGWGAGRASAWRPGPSAPATPPASPPPRRMRPAGAR